jgi:hypothetical protein
MKYLSIAVLALIGHSSAYKLMRVAQQDVTLLQYEDSEGPTKADNGEGEPYVIGREVDLNNKKEKESGWTNPLGWTDDGTDDDQILNLKFMPLDEPYKRF